MELPELSLAPRLTPVECSSSESSDSSSSRKRKAISDSFLENKSLQVHRNIIDLQHSNERLPLDWEQCLDLQSGKMYFLNRKTLKKSWDRPTNKVQYHHQYNSQKLDLELNMSSSSSSSSSTGAPASNETKPAASVVTNKFCSMKKSEQTTAHGVSAAVAANYSKNKEMKMSNDNMVAMACMNCHMLVIVSKSSPTCPNCKFVHSIPSPAAQQTSRAPTKPTFKPLDTLSLFS